MTVREQLASNLGRYRRAAGYTQKAVATRLNTKITTISSWERGISQPSADMLVELATLYEVTLSDLCGTDYKVELTPEDKALLTAFRKSDDLSKEMVRRILGIQKEEALEDFA